MRLLLDVISNLRPPVHHGTGGVLYSGENGPALDGLPI